MSIRILSTVMIAAITASPVLADSSDAMDVLPVVALPDGLYRDAEQVISALSEATAGFEPGLVDIVGPDGEFIGSVYVNDDGALEAIDVTTGETDDSWFGLGTCAPPSMQASDTLIAQRRAQGVTDVEEHLRERLSTIPVTEAETRAFFTANTTTFGGRSLLPPTA